MRQPFLLKYLAFCLLMLTVFACDDGQRARSWYTQGQKQLDEGHQEDAVLSLLRADALARQTKDPLLLANIQASMGNAYSKSFLFEDALVCYETARSLFLQAKDTTAAYEVIYSAARTLNNLKQYNKADSLFVYLLRKRDLDTLFQAKLFADYALLKITHDHDYMAGQMYYNHAVDLHRSFYSHNHFGAYAYTLEQTGFPDKADRLFAQLERTGKDSLYASLVWKGRIMAHRGLYQEASGIFEAALEQQTDNMRSVLQQSALRTQRDYYERALLQTQRENKLIRATIILIFIVLMVLVYAIDLALRRRKERARTEQEAVLETARLLSEQVESLQEERTRLQAHFTKIHRSHFKEMGALLKTSLGENKENIAAKQTILYANARQAMAEIQADTRSNRLFEEKLNDCFEQVMTRLREEIPNHTDEYYRFAGYVFAGFDNETLMALTGTHSLDSVYAKKKRLRQDIASSEAPHKTQFQQLL